jgi:hypothetical protein
MRHPPRTVRPKVLTVGSIPLTAPGVFWTRHGAGNQKWSGS